MQTAELLKRAFHYRLILVNALFTLPYKSPIRQVVEKEFLGILNRNWKAMDALLGDRGRLVHYSLYPLFTVETFERVLSKYLLASMKDTEHHSAHIIEINALVKWWNKSLGSFAEDQVKTVAEIVRKLPSAANLQEYILMLLSTLPETDAFDPIRDILHRQFLGMPLKIDPLDTIWVLTDVERVASWDINSKKFKAVWVPDDTRRKILEEDQTIPGSHRRNRLFQALLFALRTEEEFLDYWKRSTDAWRRDLARMHGKMSKPLIDRLIRKYHRNTTVLDELLKHPLVDNETLMFYAIRGNVTAKNILNQRTGTESEVQGG